MAKRITGAELTRFALAAVEMGAKYWYGTCWYRCTQSLLTRKAAQYPSHYTSNRMATYKAHIAAGLMCADCVGLIKGAAWTLCGTVASVYGGNGCPDKSADGMLAYCKSKGMEYGAISNLPEVPGLLLHKSGHVGVYIGGGYAVEAKGFNYGIIKSKVAGRGWTSWAYLPFVEYDGSVVEVPVYKLGDRTLKRGMDGDDVGEMQTGLVLLGFDCGSFGEQKDGVDGDFGYATEAAVKAFQQAVGIEVDGVFGPVSFAAFTQAMDSGLPDDGDDGAPDEPGAGTARYTAVIHGMTPDEATQLIELFPDAVVTQDAE